MLPSACIQDKKTLPEIPNYVNKICNVKCKTMWEKHHINPRGDRKCIKGFCYSWQEGKQHVGHECEQMF